MSWRRTSLVPSGPGRGAGPKGPQTSKGSRKKNSSLNGRVIKEKRTFFLTLFPTFQRPLSSRGEGLGLNGPAIKRTFLRLPREAGKRVLIKKKKSQKVMFFLMASPLPPPSYDFF